MEQLTFKKSYTLNAPAEKAWDALTDPAKIREWLFGANTVTNWKKDSPITYTGVYQGKEYQDKGTIIDIVPERLLHTTYLSSMSGKEDKPENYANVIYELEPQKEQTTLTISQDNIKNQEELKHMEENWGKVAEGIKKVVEK